MRLKEGSRINVQEAIGGWGPTLLGCVQEVLGIRDAGVYGLQQSHEVLLAPGQIYE